MKLCCPLRSVGHENGLIILFQLKRLPQNYIVLLELKKQNKTRCYKFRNLQEIMVQLKLL